MSTPVTEMPLPAFPRSSQPHWSCPVDGCGMLCRCTGHLPGLIWRFRCLCCGAVFDVADAPAATVTLVPAAVA